MAFARIVTIKNGTVIKNVNMTGHSINAVDNAAVALDSIICEERKYLRVEVDYEGCEESNLTC